MSADIGYLQTKISQLSDKVELLESENKQIKIKMEENKIIFEKAKTNLENVLAGVQKQTVTIMESKLVELQRKPLEELARLTGKNIGQRFERERKQIKDILKATRKANELSFIETEKEFYNNIVILFEHFAKENNLKYTKPKSETRPSSFAVDITDGKFKVVEE